MNESGACLAITEKRPQSQRPGGCVGIFFQLFDWNRRFAKKKLFSKKLLAPARAKLAAKNLGGDEKMPKAKLHLIADENSMGFTNMKRNGICGGDSDRRHEMKAPSLVARLMGLESMPATSREKPKKASVPKSVYIDERRSFIGSHDAPAKEVLSLEKETMKLDTRPQKLQKTGPSEKQGVTRFGAEAFQFKNVLSRSRKHQHPKLAPPVKSPRASSGRNVSRTRLIDMATRILEPGLQATNRAKCSLTYPSSMHCSPNDEIKEELIRVRSQEPFNEPGYNASESESLDDMNFSSYEQRLQDFPSPAPNFIKVSMEQEKGAVLEKSRDLSVSQPIESLQARSVSYKEGKSVSKVGQERLLSPNKPCKPRRIQAHDQMSLGKDRVSSRAKSSDLQSRRVSNAVSESKDFVSLNRNLSGRTRPRVASKVDNERKSCNMRDDSLPKLRSPVRKRRSVNVNGNADRSKLENERNLQSNGFSKDGNVISFSFNSPLRSKTRFTGSATTGEKMREQKCLTGHNASHQRKLMLDGNNGERHFEEPCPLRGDALSALLEQKLKELTSQEEDELTTGVNLPKRSTAVILQELITALNAEQLNSHDFLMSGANTPLQAKAMNKGTVTSLQDGDHFSPGSVLEASFSNDSCFSSSMDESSGPRMRPDIINFSHYQQQPLSDKDLLDSATSWSRGKACTEMVSHLINHISQVLESMNLAGLTETKFTEAIEVIFNTELLFGNVASPTDFLVGPFLLDELERFVQSTWPHYIGSLSLGKSKGGVLRGFLFDSMIESLDLRYGSAGYKTWSCRVPLGMNEGVLIQEIDEDVRKWTEMVGKVPDEIVEWEMSHGLGKWIDFDAEVFETGVEIDRYILDNLVQEIVIDL